MKATFAIFALCLAYACAAPKVNDFPELEKLVSEQKVIMLELRDGLVASHDKINGEADSKLKEAHDESKRDTENVIEVGTEDIRTRYENAMKEGRDATKCYETAKTKLTAASESSNNLLEHCFGGIEKDLVAPFHYLLTAAEFINQLSLNLDKIIPECNKSAFDEMKKCVVAKLDKSKEDLKKTVEYGDSVKAAAEDALKSAVEQGGVCKIVVFNAIHTVVLGSDGIRSTAATCIWFAEAH